MKHIIAVIILALAASTAAHAKTIHWGAYDCNHSAVKIYVHVKENDADHYRLIANGNEQIINGIDTDKKSKVSLSFRTKGADAINDVVMVLDGANVDQAYVGLWHEGNNSPTPDKESWCKLTGITETFE